MKLRMKSRTVMVCIVILGTVLVTLDRARHSHWARYYSQRYKIEGAGLPLLRKTEASLRAAGQLQRADEARAGIAWREGNLRRLWWKWLKALFLDEP